MLYKNLMQFCTLTLCLAMSTQIVSYSYFMLTKDTFTDPNKQSFLEHKIDINQKDILGNTPLIIAAKNGNDDLVEFLIKQGADVNARDAFGNTPLMHAAFFNQTSTAKKLLDAKADPNAQSKNGLTPLMAAAIHLNNIMLNNLLHYGANAHLKDRDGDTALKHLEVENDLRKGKYLAIKNILQKSMLQ